MTGPNANTVEHTGLLSKGLVGIVVPGGGVTEDGRPSAHVCARLDRAAELYLERLGSKLSTRIFVLSYGTPHKANPLDENGVAIRESAASARYLVEKWRQIPPAHILEESTSLDTIGNAYFLRTIHCDIMGFTELIVINSEFHMPRTRDIFDYVFSVPVKPGGPYPRYHLSYIAVPDVGLDAQSLELRRRKEESSRLHFIKTIQEHGLSSLRCLHAWLHTDHMAYSSTRLVGNTADAQTRGNTALLQTY